VQKLKLSKQLIGHKGCVNSLDFNNAGDVIASGSDDCNICLWNWSQGTCISKYRTAHFKNIFQVN
jgi:WD repeat-containing protein 42A